MNLETTRRLARMCFAAASMLSLVAAIFFVQAGFSLVGRGDVHNGLCLLGMAGCFGMLYWALDGLEL